LWFKKLGIYSQDGLLGLFLKIPMVLCLVMAAQELSWRILEYAKKRKANIYAEYAGGGFDLEGWKITVPQIGSNSYQKAIDGCFKELA